MAALLKDLALWGLAICTIFIVVKANTSVEPIGESVEFEFKIDGHNPNLYGDGMAVWFTTDRAKPGPVFGFIDKFEGLGIFFDTYANSRQSHSFPYVMAMLGDGHTEYDNANDGKSNEIAGCEVI
ncbi:10238_t:CDS:2 [Racocetra fulgida]|uniref:10238_t:CDS:1 n=1 Tax=Racocetra fulgida TaxID=60492 RepID=A0A9N9AZE8_9GLOM|nr:10238_t:CDS:2 [Racocetra fulgida]